jgi:hypothetical protein
MAGTTPDVYASNTASGSEAGRVAGDRGAGGVGAGERRRVWVGLAGVVVIFGLLAGLWLYVPAYRPNDEASHVAYARELSRGRLPRIDRPIDPAGDARLGRVLAGRDPVHRTIWTANHPPLFYGLVAGPLRWGVAVGRPLWGVQAARLVSVGLAALGLVVVALVVLELVPGRPQLAVAAAGLAGLLPSFVSVSPRVYNDSLAFVTTMAVVWAVVVVLVRGLTPARVGWVAVAAGVAALSRASGLLVAALAVLGVGVAGWRAGRGRGRWRRVAAVVGWAGLVGLAVGLVAGWWYVRNRVLYGDLTGSQALLAQFNREPGPGMWDLAGDPGFWLDQHRRLWGLTIAPPGASGAPTRWLWWLGVVPVVGLLVAGVGWLRQGARWADPGRVWALAVGVGLLGVLVGSMVQLVGHGHQAHARYLFPGLVVVGLAAAVGLAALPGGRRGLPTAAMLTAMTAVNLYVWTRHLDVIGVAEPSRPVVAAVLALVAVGLGTVAVALWRLSPAYSRPAGGSG